MLRRTFIATAVLFFGLISSPAMAGTQTIDFETGVIKAALAKGETVFVDYSAEWCGTCKRQERVVTQLRAENAAYNNAITFVKVDWDMYRSDAVTTSRKIPRRSTLILLKGDKELGRIIAGTSVAEIKALLDKAL